MMTSQHYIFPLSIQTTLPDDYRHNADFQRQLATLQYLGFSGVELNIAHPADSDLADIQAFLQEFDLKMTMFASGLTAKTLQLSLSSSNPTVWQRTVRVCKELIAWLAGSEIGIILGFMKGGVANDRHQAIAQCKEALRQISPDAQAKKVPVLLEATNRYESAVANRLDEAVDLIAEFKNPFLRILPDTFHINIEEADQFGALKQYMPYYDSLHLSENNRYFPGFGAIDFAALFRFLRSQNYQGAVAIEGNLQHHFIEDVTRSVDYLRPLLTGTKQT